MTDEGAAAPEPEGGGGGTVPLIPRWLYSLGGGIAAVIVIWIVVSAVRWAGSSTPPPDQSIAEQWNENIRKLGFEPVYPPVEDIAVGDVLAMVTNDAAAGEGATSKEPFAVYTLKLLHLDLTKEIEDNYQQTYQFPPTNVRPDHDGQIWSQAAAAGSLFTPPERRTVLPLVIFPRFTITRGRSASGGGGLSGLLRGSFGAAAASHESIDMRISGTETNGVPAFPAEVCYPAGYPC